MTRITAAFHHRAEDLNAEVDSSPLLLLEAFRDVYYLLAIRGMAEGFVPEDPSLGGLSRLVKAASYQINPLFDLVEGEAASSVQDTAVELVAMAMSHSSLSVPGNRDDTLQASSGATADDDQGPSPSEYTESQS